MSRSRPAAAATWSWPSGGAPVQGAWNAELKVTDTDPDHRGDADDSSLTLFCEPPSGTTWPYGSTELERVYDASAALDHDSGIWALNSANDLRASALDDGVNLLLFYVWGNQDALFASGTNEIKERECAWHGLAAVDDLEEACRSFPPPPWCGDGEVHTGILLGPPQASDMPDRWPCDALDFIERARDEAADHPDIHRVVAYDELWLILDGPETGFLQPHDTSTGSLVEYRHWSSENVRALYRMAHGASPIQPSGARWPSSSGRLAPRREVWTWWCGSTAPSWTG